MPHRGGMIDAAIGDRCELTIDDSGDHEEGSATFISLDSYGALRGSATLRLDRAP